MSLKICVIGTGYVGLVSGVCFSDLGYHVTCIDKDTRKIENLNSGVIPIYEPGLEELVHKNVQEDRLQFSTPDPKVVEEADYVLIAVGTPTAKDSDAADLGYVYAACRDIAPNLSGYTVIITKSTVPVGTGDEVEAILREHSEDGAFDVVSNPEFLREGTAIYDFQKPDRIVVGCNGEKAEAAMQELYRPFLLKNTPIIFCNRRTSELIKYASNAFLATKISFINEMADLCEAVGADITMVSKGMGSDDRIGPKFLRAGPGYGGSCFPKDTRALATIGKNNGCDLRLVDAVISANSNRKQKMGDRILNVLPNPAEGHKVGILGLAFKPDTDDIRESPAIEVVSELLAAGVEITAFDPEAMKEFEEVFPDISYVDNAYACAEDADALVIVTEWGAFRTLDFEKLGGLMKARVLVDLRNIYSPDQVRKEGFAYHSIGRT